MRPARKARERGVSRDAASECSAAGGDAAVTSWENLMRTETSVKAGRQEQVQQES